MFHVKHSILRELMFHVKPYTILKSLLLWVLPVFRRYVSAFSTKCFT
jgi:hypothetical protein